MPKMIENEEYLIQKINYIHENPVRRQYVKKPEDWIWSSANPDSDIIIESVVLWNAKNYPKHQIAGNILTSIEALL
ncbi:MAG: hypothetical protein WA126_00085 [Thermodesulfovibrionales bacterium]